MGISDLFHIKDYKEQITLLTQKVSELENMLTPEMQDAAQLKKHIQELQNEQKEELEVLEQTKATISNLQGDIDRFNNIIAEKKRKIIELDDETVVQEFGLYKPTFEFADSLGYKEALAEIRQRQKDLIKNDRAVVGSTTWTVNDSRSKGQKMVNNIQKLILRAFNSDCDTIISKVKYTNYDASLDKIYKTSDAITKLGSVMSISITREYLDCKVRELRLAFEYQQRKQEEKEELRAARAEMREAAKLQKEIEEQRKKIEKEQTHYQTVLEHIDSQLSLNPNDPDLLAKKESIVEQLAEIDKSLTDIDYREANQRAGYVYVISNIGSFGENVYKIGMTRRLDPQDRVDELGDASVPFNFDVHAMIFSDDAPALEAALHRAFENKKVNMVNQRREFFNVTLEEIKNVIKQNFDKTVEFIDIPDAEQYRVTQKMKSETQ